MDGGGISGAEDSDPRGSSDRENLGSLGSQVIHPISTKWTDEKHSLYLNSIEASFIDQLYNNELRPQDLLGCFPRRHVQSNSPLLNAKGQSKDQLSRWGCWGSSNYERGKIRADIEKETHHLSANQWIRHFRSSIRREECVLSPDQMNLDESMGEVNSIQKAKHRRDGSHQPDLTACHPHLCRLDSVGSSSEVSDQNFSDEEHEGGKSNSAGKRRKVRMPATTGQYKDQVVPSGLPFRAPRSTANNSGTKPNEQNLESEPHLKDT